MNLTDVMNAPVAVTFIGPHQDRFTTTARHCSYDVPYMYSIDLAWIGILPSRLFTTSVYLCFGGLLSITTVEVPPEPEQQMTSSYPVSDDQDQDDIPNWEDFDDDNDGIPDTVECGYITIDPFVNGGFEEPGSTKGSKFFTQANVPGWSTTASDEKIEIWSYTGSSPFNVYPHEGNNFAELNATQVSTLYQEMSFNGAGGTLSWSVRHRGRSGVDVANVSIGPSLAEVVVQETMSDGTSAWGYYSGTYAVDTGVTSLTFAFEAVSAAGSPSVGNFIDDIVITLTQECLDSDGDGLINSLDLDSDGDGIADIIEAGGTDTDGDGMVDYSTPGDPMTMTDVDSDGVADAYDDVDSGSGAGEYTSGTSLSTPNTDGIGAEDFQDIDADDDGIVDNTEAQGSFIYVAPSGSDTDGDGIDDAYDTDCQPCGGITGISIVPVDSDNDGQPDFQDSDSDADGFPDSVEGHDTNGDGTVDGTDSPNANTGLAEGDSDADADGLLDGYDNDSGSFDATNGSMTASSHPDFHGVTSERDWREQYVLPVEWTWFRADQVGKIVHLSWMLNSADDVDHFSIERSSDGLLFESIGRTRRNDQRNSSSGYSFSDTRIPPEGGLTLFYRIRLVNINGAEQTSDILEWVTTESSSPISLKAFPNPTRGTLRVVTWAHGPVRLQILNASGELVYTRSWNQQAAEHAVELDTGDWPSGVYNVTLLQHEVQTSRSFIVLE